MQGYKDTRGARAQEVQGHLSTRGARIQGCNGYKVQGHKGCEGVQGHKGCEGTRV